MKKIIASDGNDERPALKALRRAAQDAIGLARRTGTAVIVWRNGKIVDAAKRQRTIGRNKRSSS